MELLTPDYGLVFWTTLTFVILLVLLRVLAWKPIVNALKGRTESIENALASAEKAREEMAAMSARNEEILKEAKEERNNIIREANKVKDQIVGEAKDKALAEASKIMEDAKEDIEVQKKAVMAEMKNAAAALSVEIAEKVLEKELSNKGAQESFINEMASKAKLN